MKSKFALLLLFLLQTPSFVGSQVPSPREQKHHSILITGAYAHIGNGESVATSAIGIRDGKILFVKNSLTYAVVKSEWDTIVDVSGKHIYPGFIAPNTTIGLTEIDAVRATRDFNEVGDINPNVRTLIAYNTDSKIIYTVRSNGVLVCQSTPRGGMISGTSSVMALDGWNWEDAVYKADDGIHINWPRRYRTTGGSSESGTSADEKYAKLRQQLYEFVSEAEAYCRQHQPESTNLKYEAFRQLFKDNQRLYFHANFAPEINDIIDFVRAFKIKYPVIVGGYDAPLLSERLKENGFSIIVQRINSLPEFEEDLTFSYYELPFRLQEAGLLFCLDMSGDMEAMNSRNLPFLAGTASAYGLSEEQAVAAISLNAAKILGVSEQIGSLEPGKDATLFVSDGDALDIRTNNVVFAMIKGSYISLDNHQKKLSEKYHTKYGLE